MTTLLSACSSGTGSRRRMTGRLGGLTGAAALMVLLPLATACETTTFRTELALGVDAVAAPDGGVMLIGRAWACDEFELDVTFQDGTFTLSAKGTLPRTEADYCARYLDTGGSSPGNRTGTRRVKVAPGRYKVRAPQGAQEIELLYRNGVVGTSRLVDSRLPTLDSVVDELAWQHRATLATGRRLEGLLPGWTLSACAQSTDDAHRTECLISSPRGYVSPSRDLTTPLPPEAIASLGCSAADPKGRRSEVTCPAGTSEGRPTTLHTRTSWFPTSAGVASTVIWVAGG